MNNLWRTIHIHQHNISHHRINRPAKLHRIFTIGWSGGYGMVQAISFQLRAGDYFF